MNNNPTEPGLEDVGTVYQDVYEEEKSASFIEPYEVVTELLTHKRTLALYTGIFIALGLAIAFILPKQFTASTKIMPPKETSSPAMAIMGELTDKGGALTSLAASELGLKNPNDVFVGMLRSRPIAQRLIDKYHLMEVYRSKNLTSAWGTLEKSTQIDAEKDGLIRIDVTDRDPVRAAGLANDYVEGLRWMSQTFAVTEASQRRLFYEQELKSAKESLTDAEVELRKMQQKTGVVHMDEQAKAIFESGAQLRAKVAAQEADLRALRSYASDNTREVKLAQQQLDALKLELRKMGGDSGSSDALEIGVKGLSAGGVEYVRAVREMSYREALYDMLLKQLEMAKMDEARSATIIQVVEPAIPPEMKSGPSRRNIMILFTLAGFLLGCGVVLIRFIYAKLNEKPETAEQITKMRAAAMTW